FAAEARLRLRAEEARARPNGIELALELPASLVFRGDREGLMLVLRNLVANAVDWSPSDGRVEVRVEEHDHSVRVSVDDQGRGVPEADRERVFQPFERGSARPDGRLGYGLGLALVRAVVEQHHGTIRIESSRLGGACFRVELPNESSAPLPQEAAAP